ncbi:2-amino-3,7-dideoxy-D-threo-hept-6-ulosonate synthase [Halobaculum magnesiiphilum]|uniref:2-amino-3,7-dideoxy-D-threo-hept-6-ulosonate synthase n=1 Tax=Halobaculum magnesiiphilum TaxID=1017351 RepID=A0A8T8WC27_9EURY|nr:2-amino-3,7-dideoxy-D-threo-hept-6-ulosonate synthase [Halobaculum magnesiiphilum]QZP37395.1 2-amino-3,7-dideoxy-D-threo-hept-6-ulosonate synthase [Halobaculum magnesiiphilum]
MEHAGLAARMDRISTDDRILMVPMDHGITLGPVRGLKDIEGTIDAVTRGGADAVLTQKGIAPRVHANLNGAGYVVHLNAGTSIGPDSNDKRPTGTVKGAIRSGADAVSMHINVGSDYEPGQMTFLSELCEEAADYGVPVLAMAYARGANLAGDDPEHDAENLAHAVRLAEECGADLVKTAYSGDSASFEHVCESTRLPVIIAGGSPSGDLRTLKDVRGAMDAGAAGVSMGRTIFQHDDPEAMTAAVSAVVHEDADAEDALSASGL